MGVAEAVDSLRSALALWRGPAYAGFEATAFGRAERRRLDELRLAATEDLFAAQIASGSAVGAEPTADADPVGGAVKIETPDRLGVSCLDQLGVHVGTPTAPGIPSTAKS